VRILPSVKLTEKVTFVSVKKVLRAATVKIVCQVETRTLVQTILA